MNSFLVRGAGTALVVMSLAGCKEPPAPPAPPPPPEVKVAPVVQRDVPIYIEVIGETRGSSEIEVRARVEGFVETVNFQEGSAVQKGQLLYTLDPRPFEAVIAQAKGAQAEAEAQLARASQDVQLYQPLLAKNAIPRQVYDTSVQVERAAAATVEAAKANVARAQLDLQYTKVESPAAGIIGKTEVYAGTLVGRGQSTLLTRISQVDRIHVRVNIPEKDYMEYSRRGAEHRARGGAPLRFEMILSDGTTHREKGDLVFVDRAVDVTTGTMLVEIAFPNPGRAVRPGQFARVRVAIDEKKGAILIPQRAISELQGVNNVAVVKPDNTVDIRMVQASERIGNLRVIDSGLQAGDRVVVDGIQKVRAGTKVTAIAVPADEGGATPPAAPAAPAGKQ